jgi:hypothetical protein
MILVGCDLHTRKQQVALLNTDTGELRDQELSHVGGDVERFYAALSPPVTVGIESTGYSLWFHGAGRATPPVSAPPRRAPPASASRTPPSHTSSGPKKPIRSPEGVGPLRTTK